MEKVDVLDRGTYRGLQLTEQSVKIIERIAYSLKRQVGLLTGVPLENIYADDLVIIADSIEKCVRRILT